MKILDKTAFECMISFLKYITNNEIGSMTLEESIRYRKYISYDKYVEIANKMREVEKIKIILDYPIEKGHCNLNKFGLSEGKYTDFMQMSVRTYNVLHRHKIKYIGQLCQKTELEMLRLPGVGRVVLKELRDHLNLVGLRFSDYLAEGWQIPIGDDNEKEVD